MKRKEVEALIATGKPLNLHKADLQRADLSGLNLSNAKLTFANLVDADLLGADLTGVSLTNSDLTGTFGVVSISGIGSRNDTLYAWRKVVGKRKVYTFLTGCFEGTESKLRSDIKQMLRHNTDRWYDKYAASYIAAITMMKKTLDAQYLT